MAKISYNDVIVLYLGMNSLTHINVNICSKFCENVTIWRFCNFEHCSNNNKHNIKLVRFCRSTDELLQQNSQPFYFSPNFSNVVSWAINNFWVFFFFKIQKVIETFSDFSSDLFLQMFFYQIPYFTLQIFVAQADTAVFRHFYFSSLKTAKPICIMYQTDLK